MTYLMIACSVYLYIAPLGRISVAAYRARLTGWSVVLAVGHGGGRVVRTACSREGIGAAQGVGQPVPAGHAPDQIRGISAGHPGPR